VIGPSELVTIGVVGVYAWFAYQLGGLLRQGRYRAFFVRLLLAPVIMLFDWPIRRGEFRKD
jgi:hypothetical protein